ncbi:MlaD family protein [Novosphingobium ginsenosidimutans]|uniref:MCE family protein n=1 Tax=Novosphingobium ginsenosidimutans TaxID=1176536 RepID=A0A5B8S459_9SPHN|nr:MlaD family protein [Novosphingobium ginsenosidimutans]QEA16261.1 MCE family protein [Novosphingobium ginsenosidimutans]
METRANYVWVGAVTLGLLAVLAAFIIWIARWNETDQNAYDIFFKQSVDGLSKGASVSFQGVPIGQITVIELWPKDPSFVRVRIAVDKQVPILQGTTATLQSSFTGTSNILLEGAVKGAAPIVEKGPEGVPVIPTKRGGLGALLNTAPVLLDRLATVSERLNIALSDKNLKAIDNIVANTERMTGGLADASPQVTKTLTELQATLKQASTTLTEFEKVANNANQFLGGDGQALARDLRSTLKSANNAAKELEATLASARPATQRLNEQTLPQAEAAMRDLRATSKALRDLTEKIDDGGAGALLGGNKLPEYKQ